VVLENVFDPHNISAVGAKFVMQLGIQDIYILNNKIPPHRKWDKKFIQCSKRLDYLPASSAGECFAALRKIYKKNLYNSFKQRDAVGLHDLNLTEPVALVFGNATAV
jgi:tRNA (guanosine-2'-O-)-methyltransferase